MGIFDQPPQQPPATTNQPWGQPPQQPQAAPAGPPPQWNQPAPAQPQYPPAPSWPQPAAPPPQGYGAPPQYPPPGYAPPADFTRGVPQTPPPPGYGAPPAPGGYRSPFDSVTGAKVFPDQVPFWNQGEDGVYAGIIGRIRRFAARKGNVDTYSWDVKIIASPNQRVTPGMSRCKQEQASKEGADGRIVKFLMAAGNVPQSGVDDAAYHASYSEAQPFLGTLVLFEVNGGVSKAGHPFTNVAVRHPTADEAKRLAPMAAAVDPSWRPAPLQAALLR